MKKLFLTLTAALLGLANSFAQDADLQAFVLVDTTTAHATEVFGDTDRNSANTLYLKHGQWFTGNNSYIRKTTGDSVYLIYGVFNNGPDPLDPGSVVYFRSSFHSFLTEAECQANNVPFSDTLRYSWLSTVTLSSGLDANEYFAYRGDAVDSLGMLIDWDYWMESDTIRTIGPPFDTIHNNTNYGLFCRVWGVGGTSSITNTDANLSNNLWAQKIIINGSLGVRDAFVKPSVEALNVYPNPANNEIKFSYDFKQNSTGAILIKDLTGRVVKMENYGRQVAGTHNYNLNIAGLPAGNYIAEFRTGETVAVSKFVKN